MPGSVSEPRVSNMETIKMKSVGWIVLLPLLVSSTWAHAQEKEEEEAVELVFSTEEREELFRTSERRRTLLLQMPMLEVECHEQPDLEHCMTFTVKDRQLSQSLGQQNLLIRPRR